LPKNQKNQGNEDLYIEYIERLFFVEAKHELCASDDPIVLLINDYFRLMKGNINISDFSKKHIYKQENVSNLCRIDNLIVRNKFLYQK